MASHRATIQGNKERVLASGDAGTSALRLVASAVDRLFKLRDELRGFQRGLHEVATDSRQDRGDIHDWLDRVAENLQARGR